jgi:RNA polymerase sigma factor (sigma-70 family)
MLPRHVNHLDGANVRAAGRGGIANHRPAADWQTIYARLLLDRQDQSAWSAMFSHVWGRAHRDLSRRAWEMVEDIVADTCSNVLLSFDHARGAETFGGFVLGYYLNARRQALRVQDRMTVPLDNVDVPEPLTPDDGPDPGQVAQLRRALEQLPTRERTAVVLRYFEDATAAEIGRALGTSEGNARQILFRAMRRLRTLMGGPVSRPPDHPWNGGVDAVQFERNGRAAAATHVASLEPTLAGGSRRARSRS